MTYSVKEIIYTLQGEGFHSGRPAVFCRFSGCNLWSGREDDRAAADCNFCDTDFVGTDGIGGGVFDTPRDLALAVAEKWGDDDAGGLVSHPHKYVVCTGGEPLLQLDEALISAFHEEGFTVAVESNGTRQAPPGINWLTISPKAGCDLLQMSGDELKLVYPQAGITPEDFADLDFAHFYLQPKDGPDKERHTRAVIDYCLDHPKWHISLQSHKILGIA